VHAMCVLLAVCLALVGSASWVAGIVLKNSRCLCVGMATLFGAGATMAFIEQGGGFGVSAVGLLTLGMGMLSVAVHVYRRVSGRCAVQSLYAWGGLLILGGAAMILMS
jgi:hypothetical protein